MVLSNTIELEKERVKNQEAFSKVLDLAAEAEEARKAGDLDRAKRLEKEKELLNDQFNAGIEARAALDVAAKGGA